MPLPAARGPTHPLPMIDDRDGEGIRCRHLDDTSLLALVAGSDRVVVVGQDGRVPRAAEPLENLLEAARTGDLPAGDGEGEGSGPQLLAEARLVLRQRTGRHVLAGRASRPGPHGEETLAVVALAALPLPTRVRVALTPAAEVRR